MPTGRRSERPDFVFSVSGTFARVRRAPCWGGAPLAQLAARPLSGDVRRCPALSGWMMFGLLSAESVFRPGGDTQLSCLSPTPRNSSPGRLSLATAASNTPFARPTHPGLGPHLHHRGRACRSLVCPFTRLCGRLSALWLTGGGCRSHQQGRGAPRPRHR